MLPIIYLFVPGDRPERFDKALAGGADAVILDLEDAVAPDHKAAARAAIERWGTAPAARDRLVLRINDASTPWYGDDLALAQRAGLACVMLPKAEDPAQIADARRRLPGATVIALIETARGVQNVEAIAAAPGVQRLAFGTVDFAVDLGLSGDERGFAYAASRIAIASRAAELAAPIAGVTLALGDERQLQADLAFARACGFGAKLCIHPRQVEPVRRAFQPSDAEIDWARRVIAASRGGPGAVQVDGKLVDRPVLLHAQAILGRAGNPADPPAD
ncbi:MAG: HpcH/HpaI aldolase/citrate lyase family protein [Gemmatimonadota bacterium]